MMQNTGIILGLLYDLKIRGTNVVLQWIPSHCGIQGNEEADRLAKQGAALPQPVGPKAYDSIRRMIRAIIKEEVEKAHRDAVEEKRYKCLIENPIPADLPRRDAVACFRLTTGHDYLQSHLHRIGVARTPSCVLCNQYKGKMDGDHLDTCPALTDIRDKVFTKEHMKKSQVYWAARHRMVERPTILEGLLKTTTRTSSRHSSSQDEF